MVTGALSDNDRALFIERFWTRRDPSPETLTNEYRQLFWERVQEANRAFHSTRPGWMTDQGKIYILYGAPTNKQEDIFYDHDRPSGGRGVMRWLYEGRPGQRMDLDPVTVVAFEKDNSGEYKLTYDPKLNTVYWNPRAYEGTPLQDFYETTIAMSKSELGVMLDLGKMQEVPPQEQVLLERIDTAQSYQTHPLELEIQRFEHPEEEGVLVVLTLGVGQVRNASTVLARFTPSDARKKPVLISEGTFRIEEAEGGNLAQGRVVLEPDTYNVTILLADAALGSTGMYRGPLVVTPPQGGMRLSDVVLARKIEPVPYRAMVSYSEPFLIGPMKVIPALNNEVARGEAIDMLFEIYEGATPYRVSFQLEGQEDDGSWVALGPAQEVAQEQRTVAWGLPTSPRWPLGEYRIAIDVTDAAGTFERTWMPFELVETRDPTGTVPSLQFVSEGGER